MREPEDKQGRWGWSGMHAWRMQFAQRGWLRPTVLKILGEGPMNGIEIMNSIQEMSRGWWRPSPGSVYPLLEALSTEGMIRKREDGKYEIARKYKDEFGPVGEMEEALTNMEGNASYLEEMAKSDRVRLSSYKKRIEKLVNRLSKL